MFNVIPAKAGIQFAPTKEKITYTYWEITKLSRDLQFLFDILMQLPHLWEAEYYL